MSLIIPKLSNQITSMDQTLNRPNLVSVLPTLSNTGVTEIPPSYDQNIICNHWHNPYSIFDSYSSSTTIQRYQLWISDGFDIKRGLL